MNDYVYIKMHPKCKGFSTFLLFGKSKPFLLENEAGFL